MAELATINALAHELRLAVQNDLLRVTEWLGATTPKILTADNIAEIQAQAGAPNQGVKLVSFVKTKVEGDPQCYHRLVEVFEKDTKYYSNILEQLKKTYAEKCKDPPPKETPRPELTTVLNSSDLGTVLIVLRPATTDWEKIAPHLKPPLPENATKKIKANTAGHPDQAGDCLREMINLWLKQIKPHPPSWQSLRQAIQNSGIDDADSIIEKIGKQIQNA